MSCHLLVDNNITIQFRNDDSVAIEIGCRGNGNTINFDGDWLEECFDFRFGSLIIFDFLFDLTDCAYESAEPGTSWSENLRVEIDELEYFEYNRNIHA